MAARPPDATRPCRPGSCCATARSRCSPTRRPPTTRRSCCGPPPTPPTSACRSRGRRSAASTTSRGRCTTRGRPRRATRSSRSSAAATPWCRMFELLDQHGLLVQFLPEWDVVRCLPQRNAFHRYTVDRHLLEAVARAADLVRRVRRPDLLLVGALLHDLGKGGPGDHTDHGVVLAERWRPAWGSHPADVAVLVDLVRWHLLLPSYATGRDLERSRHHRRGGRRGRHRGHARPARRADRGRLARHRPDRVDTVEGRARGASGRAGARRAAPARRRRGAASSRCPTGPTRAWPRSTASLTVDPHPGGVTLVAPDALGPARGRGGRARACTPRTCAGRAPTPSTASPSASSRSSPNAAAQPDWDRFAVDLRAALVDPTAVREQLVAAPPALRLVLPADRGAPRRAPGVRRQRGHRRRHHRRGAGRRRHRRPGPDHRRVRPRTACGSTRPTCRPSATRWSTPST